MRPDRAGRPALPGRTRRWRRLRSDLDLPVPAIDPLGARRIDLGPVDLDEPGEVLGGRGHDSPKLRLDFDPLHRRAEEEGRGGEKGLALPRQPLIEVGKGQVEIARLGDGEPGEPGYATLPGEDAPHAPAP